MAEEDEAVRVLQSLRGKICEAKNLPPCHGPNKMRDCFCTIKLDQEEVYRTQVVEKSLSPFYGEDFYFEIPRSFQYLSFYICDKSFFQKDLPFGKVSIKKEDLCKCNCKDSWFALHLVDANSEVQGKVHLEVKLNELITETGLVCQQLVVLIIECQGLPLVSGQSGDPYASVSFVGPSRLDQKRTKVKKKTSNPQFDETFYFEVTRNSSYTKKSHFQVEEENIEKLEISEVTSSPDPNLRNKISNEDLILYDEHPTKLQKQCSFCNGRISAKDQNIKCCEYVLVLCLRLPISLFFLTIPFMLSNGVHYQ